MADNSFTTSQSINYQLDQSGNASVNHTIQLKNNLSLVYAKEYILTLPFLINDTITGTDTSGSIIKEIKKGDNTTVIYLEFKNPSVGKNAETNFTLSYRLNNIIVTKGKTKELELPSIPQSDTTNISLSVPLTYGQLSYSSLKPSQILSANLKHLIEFNNITLKDKKILLSFGDNQLFDFQLSYYISNPTDKLIIKEIPLPPTTNSQIVIFKSISPEPEKIITDIDGNWLSHYQLQPFQNLSILVNGQVKIFNQNQSGQETLVDGYLKASHYWPVNDPSIQSISRNLKTPKKIYDYVVDTLTYDYQRLNNSRRRLVPDILKEPATSLCTDFTDLFVTLARAANIPAREIEGYAYSNNPNIKPTNVNTDILHAWPQFYDTTSSSWKSIDPTWGNTTNGIDYFTDLDLNHFIFVIHGQSDSYPPPPGSFKNPLGQKSVNVTFANSEYQPATKPVKIESNMIYNPNLFALTNVTLKNSATASITNINQIPPLSYTPFVMPSPVFPKILLPESGKTTLLLESDQLDTPQVITFTNRSHYLYLTLLIAIVILLLSFGGIIITRNK